MNEGKILHFEDDASFRGSVAASLETFTDHLVVGEAADLPTALSVLDSVHRGELEANVVLLDGNLNGGVGGRDARAIANHIRELDLPLRIIGLSSEKMADIGVEVDVDLTKGDDYSSDKLEKVLDELGEPDNGTS
jgi:DNA-binding NarL/FixJ family response regulator